MTWPISWGEINDHLKNHPTGVSSWNDLTDKPFYKQEAETEFLGEVIGKPDEYSNIKITAEELNGFGFDPTSISVGDTVMFSINGTNYTAVAKDGLTGWNLFGDGYTEPMNEGGWALHVRPEGSDYNVIYAIAYDRQYDYGLRVWDESESRMSEYHIVFNKIKEAFTKTLDPEFLPKAEAVADLTAAPTAEQFNALLTSLRNAGYLAE